MIAPVLLEPEALFDDTALRQTLGLAPTTLAAARRDGRLRYCRQGNRLFYKGRWISDWIESASSPSPAKAVAS